MLYGFQRRFVGPICDGTKTHTIRAMRKGRARHARVGDDLGLKCGRRFRPVIFARGRCTDAGDVELTGMGRSGAPLVIIDEARRAWE